MSKKNIVLIVVAVLVVAALGFWQYRESKKIGYSVVYLSTGEVYVGYLKTFPDLQLQNGYILQVTKDAVDPTKTNFQLNPISEALWAPQVMHINEKNVVFYGPLMATSKIAEALAAKGK